MRELLNPVLKEAVDCLGGQKHLATAIGVSQQRVWGWLYKYNNGIVPAEFAIPIERATNGRVTRYDLRPDLFNRAFTPCPPANTANTPSAG